MAYVIGSQKGKDIAKNMKTDETYKASDGSTWTKKSDGSVSVEHNGQTYDNAYKASSGGSTSGGNSNRNSQYTGSSNSIKTYNSDQQGIKEQMNANSIAWWSADEEGRRVLEEVNKNLAKQLGGSVTYDPASGLWYGKADAVPEMPGNIHSWNNNYNEKNAKPSEFARDPRIDEKLNEILTRENFSYDAASDPLYQQYAQMYQREGDRAMRETMAEAAAGAGGMNTYAVTAAQQANNYYNSQLNDRIPELYQLAYEMYLAEKESEIQELGILQNMDATQYARYRDTMNDWYNDRNFAYGAYQDAVAQGNYLTEYEDNKAWRQKEWDYNDFWTNKQWDNNEYWKQKDWDEKEQEDAKDLVMYWISKGIMPDDELIERSGMNKANIEKDVAQVQEEKRSGMYG